MYGFKPQHARGKPVQNFADGGIVHSIKGALGLRPEPRLGLTQPLLDDLRLRLLRVHHARHLRLAHREVGGGEAAAAEAIKRA